MSDKSPCAGATAQIELPAGRNTHKEEKGAFYLCLARARRFVRNRPLPPNLVGRICGDPPKKQSEMRNSPLLCLRYSTGSIFRLTFLTVGGQKCQKDSHPQLSQPDGFVTAR